MEFIPRNHAAPPVIIKNLPKDYVNSVKTTTKIQSDFSYPTLEWIRQKLEEKGEEEENINNPVEIIQACSYFLLNDLAWDVYVQHILNDRAAMAVLEPCQTLIPPVHLRRRMNEEEEFWSMEIITRQDEWFHYEENLGFIFKRKVGANFSKVDKHLFFERGKLFDTLRMKMIIKWPVSFANMVFARKFEDLYFVQQKRDWIGIYTCNRAEPHRLYLQEFYIIPKKEGNDITQCDYINIQSKHVCLVKKVYKDQGVEIKESVTSKTRGYYDNLSSKTIRRYESPKIISNVVRPSLTDYLCMVDYTIIDEEDQYKIRDCNIKALYVTKGCKYIGVYRENEHLMFYLMSITPDNFLEKGKVVRCVKDHHLFDFENTVKSVYSTDSDEAWMIPRSSEQRPTTTITSSFDLWTWKEEDDRPSKEEEEKFEVYLRKWVSMRSDRIRMVADDRRIRAVEIKSQFSLKKNENTRIGGFPKRSVTF